MIYICLIVVLLLIAILCWIFKLRVEHSAKNQILSGKELKNIDMPNENSVRFQWLISFVAFTAVCVVARSLMVMTHYVALHGDTALGFAIGLSLGMGVQSVLFLTPWFLITYHCSYKKRGTKWLMLILISQPIVALLNLVNEDWQSLEFDAFSFLILGMFGIGILFWVNCLRLYSVNLTRKRLRTAT